VFDFRYHALSLIAVLVALVLGLLLGVAIGDKGLVSSAEKNIKESLRADVRAEQKKSKDLEDKLAAKDKFEQEVFPLLVDGQLTDRKIGVVFLGQPTDEINTEVQNALAASGGKRVGAVAIREPLSAEELGARASGTRYETLATGDDKLWEDFGKRMGVQLTRGGKLIDREQRRAVEGPIAHVQSAPPESIEYRGNAEHLQEVWIALRASEREILDLVTVAQVASAQLPKRIRALAANQRAEKEPREILCLGLPAAWRVYWPVG
jgi:hypothetical protein